MAQGPPRQRNAPPGEPEPKPAPGMSLRHELRTCVNQVLGYSELVQEDLTRAGQPAFVADLKRISNAARRLEALVNQVPEAAVAAAPVPAARMAAPAAEPAPSAAAPGPGLPAAAPLPPATLLVVDDDENNRDVLSRVLQSKGYGVVTAASGPEALAVVAAQPVDLVLLDIMMPEVSGLDVLKSLRARYSPSALPVIMATA